MAQGGRCSRWPRLEATRRGAANGLELTPTLHRAVADLPSRCAALGRAARQGIGFTDAGRRVVRNFELARAELTA